MDWCSFMLSQHPLRLTFMHFSVTVTYSVASGQFSISHLAKDILTCRREEQGIKPLTFWSVDDPEPCSRAPLWKPGTSQADCTGESWQSCASYLGTYHPSKYCHRARVSCHSNNTPKSSRPLHCKNCAENYLPKQPSSRTIHQNKLNPHFKLWEISKNEL